MIICCNLVFLVMRPVHITLFSFVPHFQDPMPYFSNYLDGPVHGLFATDALETRNYQASDQGLESMTNMHININTGQRW